MTKAHKILIPLAAINLVLLAGCASNDIKDPSKAYVSWHTLAQKANYAGVDIIKINGTPVKAEKNGFGGWSHRMRINPGQYEIEYVCKTLHPFSSQIQNNYLRKIAQNSGELYKRIDYGYGKTTLNFKKGKSYFFQANYKNLHREARQGLGLFTGDCTLAEVKQMSFMETFQSNLKNIK